MQLMEQTPTVAMELEGHINEVRSVLGKIPIGAIERVVEIILDAYANSGHAYDVGNGGSATNATHFACDLFKATIVEGRDRVLVTSLAGSIARLTALGNDILSEDAIRDELTNP